MGHETPFTLARFMRNQPSPPPPIARTESIDVLLADQAAVAIGVSGGKDSQACALQTFAYLDAVGHTGPRLLVHSDLGVVEWAASHPICGELAQHLKTELLVVSRRAGGLMERWESRWASSQRRYEQMETMTLVLPWSTPGMRFCTSELKTHIITAALKKRFPDRPIINVTGVRRDESAARAKSSVAQQNQSASRPKSPFWEWRPLVDYSTEQVFAAIAQSGLKPHPAYTEYGMSRVSCVFCIMSNKSDMEAAVRPEAHTPLYKRMVALEACSTFGFQGSRWLADVAPHLLSDKEQEAVADGKRRAQERRAIEATLPKETLYTSNWPVAPITVTQAAQIAQVRQGVLGLWGWTSPYTTPQAIYERYNDLYERHQTVLREREDEDEVMGPAL